MIFIAVFMRCKNEVLENWSDIEEVVDKASL